MRLLLLIICLFVPFQSLAGQSLQVVTSIKPLQLIVNQIMQGSGSAEVLVHSNQSPHHFQLKPSQLSLASHASLLIWVSNEFETGLNRLQSILPAHSHQLELAASLPPDLLIGDHHELDGHLWLAPEVVIAISRLIEQQLSTLDPQNQPLYEQNTLALIRNISEWRQQAQRRLDGIKPLYMLDHQFLAYFERSFNLQNSGSLRSSHDHGSSIRQLSVLHEQLKASPPACLLVSSLPASQQALQLSRRYEIDIRLIDTLGDTGHPETIIQLLDAIVKVLVACE